MNPSQDPSYPMTSRAPSSTSAANTLAETHREGGDRDGISQVMAVDDRGMIVVYPQAESGKEDSDDSEEVLEERRKAEDVAAARKRRVVQEKERVARAEETARRLGHDAREEELMRVREACLPGLVFLFHEVSEDKDLHICARKEKNKYINVVVVR